MKSSQRTAQSLSRAAVARSLFVFGALLAAGSCDQDDDVLHGQSGSESADCDSDGVSSCPCGIEDVVLRATVLAQDGAELTLRVEEVIHPRTPLDAGAEIRVTFAGALPCGGTTSAPVGQQALVLFVPLEEPRGVCDGGPCMMDDWSQGTARLTPWADTLLMSRTDQAQLTMPAAELDQLWGDRDECISRHGDWTRLPGATTRCPP